MADDDGQLIDFYPYRDRFKTYHRLEPRGRDRQDILNELRTMATEEDRIADAGRVSGSIYHGGHDHYAFLTEAFRLFAHANVLQRDMYPSATKLEAEIVAMTRSMLHGDDRVAGVVTFGGTESLIDPMLAYRDRARKERVITEPEAIIPVTAHVALLKAGHLLGIKMLRAPLGHDYRVDIDWVRAHVNANTIAIVGSAPNYAHGVIDPIDELGHIALEHGIGLHVDGCLGGFILPWGERLGYAIPRFDFRVPGVTSISADTHKYGYALKGTSVLLYRDAELRKHQYFNYPDWPGGIYFSPGLDGSRSGGLLAATWAAMVALGRDGYRRYARAIFETSATMQDAVRSHPELRILGRPSFLFSFTSDEFDVYHVNDFMRTRGWRFNGQQYPNALHMAVTRPQTQDGVADAFAADIADAVAYAQTQHAAGASP